MLAKERQFKILELLNERRIIKTDEVIKLFKVSGETIRRDFNKLESEERINRLHGGISLIEKDYPEMPYYEREIININEKLEIASEAIKYINEGEQIILDSSSTSWFLAKVLPNIKITVLTNSIRVVLELAKKDNIEVICTGGILLESSMSFIGRIAQISLNLYHVSKAFISSKGINEIRGLSELNEMAIMVKRKIIDTANEVFVLMDNSKFGLENFLQVVALDKISWIITDSKTTIQQINSLGKHAKKVIQVKKT